MQQRAGMEYSYRTGICFFMLISLVIKGSDSEKERQVAGSQAVLQWGWRWQQQEGRKERSFQFQD